MPPVLAAIPSVLGAVGSAAAPVLGAAGSALGAGAGALGSAIGSGAAALPGLVSGATQLAGSPLGQAGIALGSKLFGGDNGGGPTSYTPSGGYTGFNSQDAENQAYTDFIKKFNSQKEIKRFGV